jgi:cytochrome c5
MCVACARSKTVFANFAASSTLLALSARGRACAASLSGYTALGWERPRQTEVREDADLGAGDGADALTGEGQNKETEGAVQVGAGVASVDRQGGLAVRSVLCEATVVVDNCDVDEEAGRPLETTVFEWQRRHGAGSKIAPRQTFAGYQTGPAEGTVADAMREPLRRTIVYEDAGDGDAGWSHASPKSGGAISRGATRRGGARKRDRRAPRAARGPVRFATRAARPHRQRLA